MKIQQASDLTCEQKWGTFGVLVAWEEARVAIERKEEMSVAIVLPYYFFFSSTLVFLSLFYSLITLQLVFS